ncbi:hypothetical protein ACQY0O_005551 [Thecaphora frezii]
MLSLSKTLLLCAFAVQAALCAPTSDKLGSTTVFLLHPETEGGPHETLATCHSAHGDCFGNFKSVCQSLSHPFKTAWCTVSAAVKDHEEKFKKACEKAQGEVRSDPFLNVKNVQMWSSVEGVAQPGESCSNIKYPKRIYSAFFYERNTCLPYDVALDHHDKSIAFCAVVDEDDQTKQRFKASCEETGGTVAESASEPVKAEPNHAVA